MANDWQTLKIDKIPKTGVMTMVNGELVPISSLPGYNDNFNSDIGALHMNDNQGPPENPDDADDEEQADINRKRARLAELRSQSQTGVWDEGMGQEIADLLDYLRDK
jgi:hypothetical protein